MKPTLSIIIVHQHPSDDLATALEHFSLLTPPLEAIIVDFSDGVAVKRLAKQQRLKIIHLLCDPGTHWAKAANLGASHAQAETLCFLDPAFRLTDGALDRLLDWLDHHPRTVVGPRVMNNGRAMTTAHPFITARDVLGAGNLGRVSWPDAWHASLSWLIPSLHFAWMCRTIDHPAAVPVLNKSCLMMRRTVWREVGDWPAHLAEYGVESVWFRHALELGVCAWYLPSAVVTTGRGVVDAPTARHEHDRRWHARQLGWIILGLLVVVLWFERRRRR